MPTSKHEKYQRLIARCEALAPTPCAVAHPCDESSLRGAVEAGKMGILEPILVGPRARIEAAALEQPKGAAGQVPFNITVPGKPSAIKTRVELDNPADKP